MRLSELLFILIMASFLAYFVYDKERRHDLDVEAMRLVKFSLLS